MARRYEVGEHFYVITGKGAAAVGNAWSAAPNLVLQAHGVGHKPWFDLPAGIKVCFYVYEGETLRVKAKGAKSGTTFNYYDTIAAVFSGDAVVLEDYDGPCKCPNYYLSKYQLSKRAPNKAGASAKVAYADLEGYVDYYQNLPFDIATVRHRRMRSLWGPDLKELVQKLHGKSHAYTQLHVLICRSDNAGATAWMITTQNDIATCTRRQR